MDEFYFGKSIFVRVIHKHDGGRAYGLCRPYMARADLVDRFDSLEFANLVAKYVDENGGCYGHKERKAAKSWATEMIRKGK